MKTTHLKPIVLTVSAQPGAEGAKDMAFLKPIVLTVSAQHGAEGAKDAAFLKPIALSFLEKKGGCKGFFFRQASDRLPIGFRQATSTSGAGNPRQERADGSFSSPNIYTLPHCGAAGSLKGLTAVHAIALHGEQNDAAQ